MSRLGGDEFVVLIADAGSDPARCDEFVGRVAARIEAGLRRPYLVEGRALHITGTMGVSIFPRDGDSASDFLRFADTAMYREMNDTKEAQDFVVSLYPGRRLAEPEEMAKSVLYLASDASTFTSGSAMLVDGAVSVNRT